MRIRAAPGQLVERPDLEIAVGQAIRRAAARALMVNSAFETELAKVYAKASKRIHSRPAGEVGIA